MVPDDKKRSRMDDDENEQERLALFVSFFTLLLEMCLEIILYRRDCLKILYFWWEELGVKIWSSLVVNGCLGFKMCNEV